MTPAPDPLAYIIFRATAPLYYLWLCLIYLFDRLITVASVLADALVWLLLFVALAWEMGVESDKEVEG